MDVERSTNALALKETGFPAVALPEGVDTELLRLGGPTGPALLHVVCGSVNQCVACIQSGDLSVIAVRRSGSPLSMVSCVVGDHQWPLAFDSPALRVGLRKFFFAFPGFFYGLALPEGSSDEDVERLETILKMFCTYENEAGEEAYPKMKKLSIRGPSPGTPLPEPSTRDETTAKLQRALRTSAAAKLVTKVLLRNAVDPKLHVDITAPVTSASLAAGPHVLASLRTVSDVVDAVEAARGIGVGGWSMAPDLWVEPPDGSSYWHFNVAGLTMVLRAVAAVAARARAVGRVAGQGGGRSFSTLAGQETGMSTVEDESHASGASTSGNFVIETARPS
ncbi:hypothetical protein Taro_039515 [Colocasia esculenta]|uniref:Uncharacterized protein n=1 Tax=Colocasia esculenta TaxID=4460 RepID=A0A843WAV4_COLES|nr:hypothetical protein [Colocasia esculenta]